MRLKSVHAVNFCQHRDLKIEFPPGITGILGSNAAGKSNAIKAIRFAAIGDSGNLGTKAADLNWRAAAEGKSGSVELAFEQAGTTGKIKRFVNNARANLTFGEVKAGSVSAVNTHMSRILGVPDRTIKDIVFVMQGAIEEILFERPADRAKKFQGLFGTENAERLRDLLLSEVNALPTGEVDERVEQLQQELDEMIDPHLRTLTEQKTAIAEALQGFDRESREVLITKYETAASIDKQIAGLDERIPLLASDITLEHERVVAQQQCVDSLEKETDRMKGAADEAQAKLANLDAARRAHETYEKLRTEAAELETALRQPEPIRPDIDREKLTAADDTLQSRRAALEPRRSFVETFKGGQGTAQCPTCLQDVHDAGKLAAQFEAEMVQKDAENAAASRQLDAASKRLNDYDRDIALDCARKDDARKRLQSIHGTLSTLGVTTYDSAEAGGLRVVVDGFNSNLTALKRDRDALSTLQSGLAGKQSERRTLEDQRQSLRDQLQDRSTVEQYQQARSDLETAGTAETELANVDGQLTQLQRRRGAVLDDLEQLKVQGEKLAATKEYKALCERARTLFHRDCLPQMVTQAFLIALNAKIAEYLVLFDATFFCVIKDDLSVICDFPDGGEQAADRLSGGQRVLLGIAFRFAVYALFAGDLGFMVLDEPSNMLDEDRISSVVEVLQSVRRYAQRTGLQLVIVTHRRELEATFDAVVRL